MTPPATQMRGEEGECQILHELECLLLTGPAITRIFYGLYPSSLKSLLGINLCLRKSRVARVSVKCGPDGGGWRMADGGWRMADGGWRMADGGWRMADGGWRMADGGWRMADGGWRMVACVAGGMRERASGGRAAIFLSSEAREEFASGEAASEFPACHISYGFCLPPTFIAFNESIK